MKEVLEEKLVIPKQKTKTITNSSNLTQEVDK